MMAKRDIFWRTDGRGCSDEEPLRRQDYASQRQARCGAAARDTRKKLRCSRAVFARKLRINERTLEKWEQGRAKPNPQAAALVLLVRNYPAGRVSVAVDRWGELACRCISAPREAQRLRTLSELQALEPNPVGPDLGKVVVGLLGKPCRGAAAEHLG